MCNIKHHSLIIFKHRGKLHNGRVTRVLDDYVEVSRPNRKKDILVPLHSVVGIQSQLSDFIKSEHKTI